MEMGPAASSVVGLLRNPRRRLRRRSRIRRERRVRLPDLAYRGGYRRTFAAMDSAVPAGRIPRLRNALPRSPLGRDGSVGVRHLRSV